ncbi:calcium-binding protein [Streptomyces spectabilis]|uniref:Ca2+-binding RTX toxin-like protein n=1 Tax=Streptomyces spectabilis TaxID=68270 RepID=A0A7W8ET84_STRST|nr:calcium-binding protein [Streptomyces spectabilis]MBB5102494.1 Ca2+-binding RTX toxin-like protein [Streptomyces spectabilis]MCI3907534.1 calcium-binding protein [Streptomyces spectabilis]
MALALGAGIATPVLLSGSASAAAPSATAAVDGKSVVYTAAAGQVNKLDVTASRTGSGIDNLTYVIDDVVTIKAGSGCTYPTSSDRTKVSCKVDTRDSQDPYATLELSTGDRDDTVKYTNRTDDAYYFAALDLGKGNDTLTEAAGVQGNSILGGAGDDTLTVGEVSVVLGADGKDTIRAGRGAISKGGNGNDTIYASGENSDVEGEAGNDVIRGTGNRQNLSGGDGDDTIRAGAGDDFVYGGKGNDVLRGEGGDDTIYGNSGDDKLYGGAGRDTLSGGPGRNEVHQD